MLSATLPFYAYDNFSGDSKIAGLFFTAMGAGAVIGSIGAVVVVKRFQPLRLAAIGIVALTMPLWLLPLDLPAWGVMAALFTAMLFTPLVNGPTIGVITARTPVDLRPKMMTALISISTLSAPAGFLVAGQLLGAVGRRARLRAVRDKLLGPLGATVIVLNFLGAMLSATLPFYAYDNFSGDSKIAGLFFTAMGAGAVIGSIAAVLVVKRFQPLRLAAIGIVALTVPLWLLPLDLPAWGVMAALFTAMLFTPLVNGPTIGLITARTPVDLRPKMMTALISISTLSAPAGFLVAGQLLEPWGVERVFAAVAIGMTGAALAFAAIALRHRDETAPEVSAVAA